jgi:N-acyl-D-amino-acid deacylase
MSTASVVLKGGAVIDGSGRPRVRADVALKGGKIAAVDPGCSLKGEREIDCSGLVVAPGFIDTHSHSDLRVLDEPQLPMKVRQGITLEVFGQDGISVAPIRACDRPQAEQQLSGLLGRLGRDWDWETVGEYLDAIERAHPALDCAYLVPHGAVRMQAMGMEDRRATSAEIASMQAAVRKAVGEGAVGLSTGLIYPPCCFADTAELIELCRTLAELDGIFVAHMRSESDYLEDAVAEMIEVADRSRARVHISHFKAAGRENWGAVDRVLESVRAARERGLRLTADQYPYTAGSTMLGAILPPWAHSGGVEATLARLSRSPERAALRAAILERSRSDWDNFWKWSGPEGIVISDIPSGDRPEFVGKNLTQAASISQQKDDVSEEEAVDFAFDLLAVERMGVGMISFSQSEEVVRKIMREPYVNVCTDGLLGGKPHPRAYGTYPRILGRYVREQKLLTLEEAVRKMTGLAAETFKLRGYGLIAPGAAANLVAFDADAVADNATFEESRQYPSGIECVIVQGEMAVCEGSQRGRGSGVAVRNH